MIRLEKSLLIQQSVKTFVSCRFSPNKQWYIDQMILLMVEVNSCMSTFILRYMYNIRTLAIFAAGLLSCVLVIYGGSVVARYWFLVKDLVGGLVRV